MTNGKPRLSCKFRKIGSISAADLLEMHGIFAKYYENADLETFLKDMSKKHGAFVITAPKAGRIVGFSTWTEYEFDYNGRKALGVFSGDTIIEKAYWGDKSLQRAFGSKIIKRKLQNLHRPVFWLLISKGYKTYLLLTNNFYNHYPNYKGRNPQLKQVVDHYAQLLYPDAYQTDSGILDFGDGYHALKDDIAGITEEDRKNNPKIDFFARVNPSWDRGTELPCVGEVSMSNIGYYMRKLVRRKSAHHNGPAANTDTPAASVLSKKSA